MAIDDGIIVRQKRFFDEMTLHVMYILSYTLKSSIFSNKDTYSMTLKLRKKCVKL